MTAPEPVNEADLLEQRMDLLPEEDEPDDLEPGEADPADARDQRLSVPEDDEDLR